MSTECTPFDHVAAEAQLYRAAYAEGRRAGLIEGDEAGYLVGYAVGYDTGIRDTRAFKFGCREGYIDGFLDRLGDAFARQWEGDK